LLEQKELRQLRQRIAINWELLPLSLEETRGYIQHRINVALGKGRVRFTRAGVESIYKFSHGIPRMINVLADRSLLIAYAMNTKKITPNIVRPAVKDVGGLTPLSSWTDNLWKSVVPGLAALGILFFAIDHYMLPNFNADKKASKDISMMIRENPIVPILENPDSSQPQPPAINLPAATALSPEAIQGLVVPNEEIIFPNAMPVVAPPKARRIRSTEPLVISQQDKLVTYLASLSLAESRREAMNWMLKKWNIDPTPYQDKGTALLDSIAEEQNLLAYDLNANFDKLSTFNYPAILEIALPDAQGTKYLSLVSINGDHGVFGSVDHIKMPLELIESVWTHKSIILWKDFESLPDSMGPGFKGRSALWLQKNLRLLGFFQGLEAPTYGPNTQLSVAKFQRAHHIKDDGWFGIESRVMLYGLSNIYQTPKLVNP